MKSQLVILLILVSSLLATNADQQCDNLLQQCNQFKTKCSPDMITIRSCCHLADLPHSKAPSGVYQIISNCSCGSPFTATIDVYCDMDTSDGGWMVIQRNVKDGVNIFASKKWKEYEGGFGDLKSSKFWYGLKALHCFTQTGQWELRIDFQFDNITWSHLHYNTFSIGPESKEYPLTIGGFTGTTTDPFVTHPLNGQRFSTFDNDNDKNSANCATGNGGWWYNNCWHINPNYQPPYIHLNSKTYYPLSMETKIRPRDCIIQ
ncbi:fibrinogen-like protein A [Dysidea avara]|uniref:fibrinogen-like protein A n=1 Tax=Dysidea avara TaxID=196820 RepID=UPI00331F6AFB